MTVLSRRSSLGLLHFLFVVVALGNPAQDQHVEATGIEVSILVPEPGDSFQPQVAVDLHLSFWEGKDADAVRSNPASYDVCYSGGVHAVCAPLHGGGGESVRSLLPSELPNRSEEEAKSLFDFARHLPPAVRVAADATQLKEVSLLLPKSGVAEVTAWVERRRADKSDDLTGGTIPREARSIRVGETATVLLWSSPQEAAVELTRRLREQQEAASAAAGGGGGGGGGGGADGATGGSAKTTVDRRDCSRARLLYHLALAQLQLLRGSPEARPTRGGEAAAAAAAAHGVPPALLLLATEHLARAAELGEVAAAFELRRLHQGAAASEGGVATGARNDDDDDDDDDDDGDDDDDDGDGDGDGDDAARTAAEGGHNCSGRGEARAQDCGVEGGRRGGTNHRRVVDLRRVALVTISNAGYAHYTLNALASLRHLDPKGRYLLFDSDSDSSASSHTMTKKRTSGAGMACKLEVVCLDAECRARIAAELPECPFQVQSIAVPAAAHATAGLSHAAATTAADNLDAEERLRNFAVYNSEAFNEIVRWKFFAIHDRLRRKFLSPSTGFDFVVFTDGDIVFLDSAFLAEAVAALDFRLDGEAFDYEGGVGHTTPKVVDPGRLSNDLSGTTGYRFDLAAQCDAGHQNPRCEWHFPRYGDGALCSGFMVIRATPRTAELFDPGRIFSSGEEEGAQYREHFEDQMYLNEVLAPRLGRDRVTTLDRARFPNGAFYRVQQQKARRMSGEAPGHDGGDVAASSHNDSDAKRQTKTRNSAAQPTDIDLATVRRPRDQHDGAAANAALPSLIHFNFNTGGEKKEEMERAGFWFL